jgi:tetratricopeptide (TPR) repeat protein/WD40 repeat protein
MSVLVLALPAAAAAQAPGQLLPVPDPGGHTSPITGLLFTPDGRELISFGRDKTVRVWDVATGRSRTVIRPPVGPGAVGMPYSAAVSPDSRLLAVGGLLVSPPGGGYPIYLIDLADGRLRRLLAGHPLAVDALAFSPDGKRLASGGAEGVVLVWDVASGQVHLTLRGHTGRIYGLAFSPDGRRLVSGGYGQGARIWGVASGRVEAVLGGPVRPDLIGTLVPPVGGLTVLPAGLPWPAVALYGQGGLGHRAEVQRVAWSPDGRTLATGSVDGSVRLWRPDGTFRKAFEGFGGASSLAFTPDGRALAVTTGSGALLFDLSTGRRTDEPADPEVKLMVGALAPGGALAAAARRDDDTIVLWDLKNKGASRRLAAEGRVVWSVGWSPDGQSLGWDSLFPLRGRGEPPSLKQSLHLGELRFGPAPDGTFQRARLKDGELSLEQWGNAVAVLRKGVKTAQLVLPDPNDQPLCYTLTGDDRAAVASWRGLYLFSVRTGQRLRDYQGWTERVRALAPSPDGRYLAAACEDRVVRIWHVGGPEWRRERNELVLSLFFAGKEWAAWTPEGYHRTSPGGRGLLRWYRDRGPLALLEPVEDRGGRRAIAALKGHDALAFRLGLLRGGRLTESAVLERIHEDLRGRGGRGRLTRYLLLTPLYNAELARHPAEVAEGLSRYRRALSKLLNSLSWKRQIKPPEPIDPLGTVLRLDLDDYGWDAAAWQRLVAEYPYGIKAPMPAARAARELTGCDVPYVRGDWFAFAASRPPLYHDLLGLPQTVAELERKLGVDAEANRAAGRVARAGFTNSDPSRSNRLLERHPLDRAKLGYEGAYWRSFDFKGGAGRRNLLAHPLGPGLAPDTFAHDGEEILFTLPNGLQAYLLADSRGRRLDSAPIEIVSNVERLRDPVVVNGASCIDCHSQGINALRMAKEDQVRGHVMRNRAGYGRREVEAILDLYPLEEDFRALLRRDAERFNAAVAETGAAIGGKEPWALANRYREAIDLTRAAAEVGLTPSVFRKQLEGSPTLRRILGFLLAPGGTVPRDVFAGSFALLVSEWGLGEVVRREVEAAAPAPGPAAAPAAPQPTALATSGWRWATTALALLAAAFVGLCLTWRSMRRHPVAAAALALLAAASVAASLWALGWLPLTTAADRQENPGAGPGSDGHVRPPAPAADAQAARQHYRRGKAEQARGDLELAIAAYTEALRRDPDYAEACRARGKASRAAGDLSGAVRDFTRLIRLRPGDAEAYRERGAAHAAGRAYRRAVRDLSEAIRLDPGSADAYAERAGVYLRGHLGAGDYARALADCDEAIRLDPQHFAAHYHRGRALLQAGLAEEALKDLNRALELNFEVPACYVALAAAHRQLGKEDAARSHLSDALEVSPRHPADHVTRAWAHYERGEFDRAVAACTEAIRQQRRYPEAYYCRALAYARKGAREAALASCEEMVRLNPDSLGCYADRAEVRAALGDVEGAVAGYGEVIRRAPEDLHGYLRRSPVHLQAKRPRAALADLAAAIELDPANAAAAYCARGLMRTELRDYGGAVLDLAAAVQLDPKNARLYRRPGFTVAYYEVASQYRQRQRYGEALAAYQRAAELSPRSSWPLSARAEVFTRLKRFTDAIREYTKAIDLNPEAPWERSPFGDLYYSRGLVYGMMGKMKPARDDFSRSIAFHKGRFAEAYCMRGLTWAEQNRWHEAIADFTRAIEVRPDHAQAHYYRGMVRRLKGRPREALPDLNKAIEIDPGKAKFYRERALVHEALGNAVLAAADWFQAQQMQRVPPRQAPRQDDGDATSPAPPPR